MVHASMLHMLFLLAACSRGGAGKDARVELQENEDACAADAVRSQCPFTFSSLSGGITSNSARKCSRRFPDIIELSLCTAVDAD